MSLCSAASNNGWQAVRLAASSARYRRWNSFHLAGSWLNQRRSSLLGATSLHQAAMCNASFFFPRGQRRSTRKRKPSSSAGRSYTRLIWIIVNYTSEYRPIRFFDRCLSASPVRFVSRFKAGEQPERLRGLYIRQKINILILFDFATKQYPMYIFYHAARALY